MSCRDNDAHRFAQMKTDKALLQQTIQRKGHSLPLEVGPLNPDRGLGERCELPRAEVEFGAFYPCNLAAGGNDFIDFVMFFFLNLNMDN